LIFENPTACRSGSGSSVVLVSSLAARAVVGTIPAYAATKGAIDTLVKHLASALGQRGIERSCLSHCDRYASSGANLAAAGDPFHHFV
jgi:NAD(P)-dependent dehydrogenase (short-subunit alcohol dehydrogenase family)